MVARLSSHFQDNLLQMLLAISEGRGDDVVTYALKIGGATRSTRTSSTAASTTWSRETKTQRSSK